MTKVMPLSFSRLSTFEQCPAQFDYLYVSKRVQSTSNESADYGDRVHKVLEAYGNGTLDEQTLSEEGRSTLKQWGAVVDKITSRSGTKLYEHQMAVNRELKPVDWFASDVWIRSIADVLVVDGDTAYCLDYKTGKVKENPTQLQLFAAMVMWHFPEVNTVKTSFIWLKFNQTTNAKYERRFLDALWRGMEPRFDKVQEIIDLGVFNTKPSGLCPWCPAKAICPDARLKGKR
ncbi:PD-(D/E)XK nuclease family protein [bacterium]|jgi:RecB family exonuclease|nr:PD-(D/E)XK nuclease family protein [bacterium]